MERGLRAQEDIGAETDRTVYPRLLVASGAPGQDDRKRGRSEGEVRKRQVWFESYSIPDDKKAVYKIDGCNFAPIRGMNAR